MYYPQSLKSKSQSIIYILTFFPIIVEYLFKPLNFCINYFSPQNFLFYSEYTELNYFTCHFARMKHTETSRHIN